MPYQPPVGEALTKNKYKSRTDLLLSITILLLLILMGTLIFLLFFQPHSQPIPHGASFLHPTDEPVQSNTTAETITVEANGLQWSMHPRATFQIAARVLGNKRYYDGQSSIIPRDLALGWGEMSEQTVDDTIQWRQSGRWYHYEWNHASPYDGQTIATHSANIHIVPATYNLGKALRTVGKDEMIYLERYLVDIEADGYGQKGFISTSLTREDSGKGACEILYVTRLVVGDELYE